MGQEKDDLLRQVIP